MTNTYQTHNTTCQSCLKTIKTKLEKLGSVQAIEIIADKKQIKITSSKHISLKDLNQSLTDTKYTLSDVLEDSKAEIKAEKAGSKEVKKYKFSDFLPLGVLLDYIFIGAVIITWISGNHTSFSDLLTFDFWMHWMQIMMGLWFSLFAMFKLFNLRGFAEGYSTYDLISQKWFGWGFVYPFVELGLGVVFLLGIWLEFVLPFSLVLMLVSGAGVAIKLAKKEQFECACLGTIFKLPLTKISLFENLFMAMMAVVMMVL